jgi:signal transduction histidine kinase
MTAAAKRMTTDLATEATKRVFRATMGEADAPAGGRDSPMATHTHAPDRHGSPAAAGSTDHAVRPAPTAGRRPRWLPWTARTRIIAWVLLLVLAALAVVTLATWRLLVRSTDERMDAALAAEIEEFAGLTESGIDPGTGLPFGSVDDVLRVAITYNLARPNEKFLGYVDGAYRYQSREQAPVLLKDDPGFTALVAGTGTSLAGRYESGAGEVRYLAVPVTLAGDPAGGVLVAAYFADQERAGADEAARLMLGVGGLTLLAAAAGAWLVAGRILRPLRDVAATARDITETDLSRRIAVPEPHRADDRDELHDLVRTVNSMLDRIERGVEAQRRFVDDAGHELRTPITIVRGHLEVLQPTDPDDVRATVRLVDDELGRMNRMVSDLLLLARSEQPSFLHVEPVDVAELTRAIVGKVVHLGERDWALDAVADLDAVLDPQRITQAVMALADNAVRHTARGGRIGIGSQLTAGWLRFWVTDSGPGIPPADRARIFERFDRGSAAAPRSEGAGLGLAIVRAIAQAHGGEVTLDSVPGRGSTFAVVLPAVRVR